MPAGQALRGTLGPWPYVIEGVARGEIGGQVFYRWQMGTLDLAASARRRVEEGEAGFMIHAV